MPPHSHSHAQSPRKPTHYITVAALICFCYFLDLRASEWLPDATHTHTHSLTTSPTSTFSPSTARQHLKDLVALGPRIAGTATNDLHTATLLTDKLLHIQANAPPHVKIEIEQQHPSGSLYLGFLNGITNIYKNVTNVVVRISWPEVEAQHSHSSEVMDQAVLVNAHFDSVAGSPGASDDGIGVAVMLEATRSLVMGEALKKPVVMLFNGAEESNHHAAHGFITQHKWAKSIKYLINLEAIGAGGREMVFQCNSGELMALYGKTVPFPHAHAVAHELFKHIIWRAASTDWLTILKHGSPGMHGLDTAYLKNGYVYHTHNDKESILKDGTFINTGLNVLQLTKALSLSTEDDFSQSATNTDPGQESAVFFDILSGYAFFSYRGNWVYMIHLFVVVFGASTILALCPSSYSNLSTILVDELKCLLFPIINCLAMGLFCHIFCPMTWYLSGKGYAILLFMPPAILSAIWIRGECAAARPYSKDNLVRQSSALLLWISIAIPMIFCGLVSAYPFCFWIGFSSIGMIMYVQVVNNRSVSKRKIQAHTTPSFYSSMLHKCDENLVYMVCVMPCTIAWCSLLNVTLSMLIPLVGKSGTVVPGDIIVGAVIGALVALPAGSLMANHVFSKMTKVTVKAFAGFIAAILFYTILFNNVAYSVARPKRLWLQHVDRVIEKNDKGMITTTHDHGIWVSAFDGQGLNPLVDLHHSQIKHKHREKASCNVGDGDCFMSFPWYFPVPDSIRDSMYIPTQSPPVPIEPTSRLQLILTSTAISRDMTLDKVQKRNVGGDSGDAGEYRFIDVAVVGPTHMALVIRDHAAGSRIVGWDLGNMNDITVDQTGSINQDSQSRAFLAFKESSLVTPYSPRSEGIYYLQIGFGLCPSNACTKVIRLKVKGNEPVEFSAYGHYVEQWEEDPSLQAFHNSLPKWSQNAYFTQFPSMLVSKSI